MCEILAVVRAGTDFRPAPFHELYGAGQAHFTSAGCGPHFCAGWAGTAGWAAGVAAAGCVARKGTMRSGAGTRSGTETSAGDASGAGSAKVSVDGE